MELATMMERMVTGGPEGTSAPQGSTSHCPDVPARTNSYSLRNCTCGRGLRSSNSSCAALTRAHSTRTGPPERGGSHSRAGPVALSEPASLCHASFEGAGHDVALVEHLLLVLVQPRVPLLGVIEVLCRARIGLAKVGADVVAACQGSVVAALDRNGF